MIAAPRQATEELFVACPGAGAIRVEGRVTTGVAHLEK